MSKINYNLYERLDEKSSLFSFLDKKEVEQGEEPYFQELYIFNKLKIIKIKKKQVEKDFVQSYKIIFRIKK